MKIPFSKSDSLFGVPGCERLSIDVDHRLLAKIHPEHILFVTVLLEYGFHALVEAFQSRLATAEHGETGQLEKKSISFASYN